MTEFENLVLRKLESLDGKIDKVTERLEKHMEEEEGEIEAMIDAFNQFREESNRRFDAMSGSLLAYSDNLNHMICEVQSAFLKTPDGKPDYPGHYYDHDLRKGLTDAIKELLKDAMKVVGKGVLIAAITAALYGVWEAFLRGPK